MDKKIRNYLDLIKKYPDLVKHSDSENSIRIITNPNEIISHQNCLKKEFAENNKPSEWIDIGVLIDDPWFYIIRDLVEFPNGGEVGGYIRLVEKRVLAGVKGVVILPIYNNDKIILVNHFRHENRDWVWEAPRGFGESGIAIEDQARKELLEETGIVPNKLLPIKMNPKNANPFSRAEYFIAEITKLPDNIPSYGKQEGILEIASFSKTQIESMIISGELYDDFTIKSYILANLLGYIGT